MVRRQSILRICVLAAATAMALASVEVTYRWHLQRTFDDEFPEWTENLVAVRGAQVFAFKPNASGVFPGSIDSTRRFAYRTNAHGLRDRDRGPKAPGIRRVLVMGDSYTWGYAVAEEEAYPQVAERLLAAAGRRDVEVINGGIPDYNSRQEQRLLAQLAPIYDPDAVFLAYVVNDAEPSTAMPVPPEETYRHVRSWFLAEWADHLNRHVFRRALLPTSKDSPGNSYLDGFEARSAKWRDSREAIREMRDLSAERGADFSILILPDVTQPLDEGYPWRPIHDAVSRWGEELGVPTFDLLDEFQRLDQRTLMVPWDGHPNAEAHRRIAEFLVARVLAIFN